MARKPKARPSFVPPMAAVLVDQLPAGDEWLYEAKFDGHRAMAIKEDGKVRILSRKGNDLSKDYPAVAAAVRDLRGNHEH